MKLGIGPRDWDEHAKLYYCMKQMVKRGFIEKVSSGYYKITTHGMTMRDEWTKGADNE
jgi:predicted transcriptional regulator